MNLQCLNAVSEKADDAGHRQSKIIMRSDWAHRRFQDETPDGCDRHDVCEGNEKGKSGDAGECADLNNRPVAMPSDAETVPSPTGKNPAAQPFLGGPNSSENKSNAQIVHRTDPRRTRSCRLVRPRRRPGVFMSRNGFRFRARAQQSAKPTPDGEVNRHVKLKQKPAQTGDCCQPGKDRPKKSEPGDIPEQKVAQPTPFRVFSGKPNCCEQRSESEPAEPGLIEGRKTAGAKQTGENSGQPRPCADRFSKTLHRDFSCGVCAGFGLGRDAGRD